MLAQVHALVEPLTRLDRGSLALHGSDTAAAALHVRVHCEVSFETGRSVQTGRLPAGVHAAGSEAAASALAQAWIESQRAALPGRLQGWLALHANDPAAELDAADCAEGRYLAGFTRRCADCAGQGEVGCSGCAASGWVNCWQCHGRADIACPGCGGSGDQACGSCGGRGSVQVQYQRWVHDAGAQGQRQETEWRIENCPACRGGRVPCSRCGRRGRVDCPQCVGGRIRCTSCGGSGRTACQPCAATGCFSEVFAADGRVQRQLGIGVDAPWPEARAHLQAFTDVAGLNALAPLAVTAAQLVDTGVERRLGGKVPLARLMLGAGGEDVELLGYGADCRIVDFKNLVGRLLQADLDALGAELAQTPWLMLSPRPAFDAALARCLASEAHAAILERALAVRGAPAALYGNAVSADYVKAAGSLLRRAHARALRGEQLGAALLLPAGAMLLFGAALLPAATRPWAAVSTGAAIVMGGFVWPWWLRRRLNRRFDATTARRLAALSRPLRWGLVSMAVAAAGVAAVAWMVLRTYPMFDLWPH